MEYQRILSVQDISCIGQCSMAVALPILSCCGHEAVMLPTAVLSTQTGVFGQPHVRDISGDIPAISEHWAREGIMFDAVLTGYLGTNESVRMVRELLAAHKACGARVIVDPVMADNGKLYAGFDESYCGAMRALCREADVMIPNITEAAILSGLPYREHYDADYIAALITHLDTENVVLTGVSFRPGETGVMVSESGALHYYAHRREEKTAQERAIFSQRRLRAHWGRGETSVRRRALRRILLHCVYTKQSKILRTVTVSASSRCSQR